MHSSAKQKVDDVLHARWIIPIIPEQVVLEHHSLVIENGDIALNSFCLERFD